MKSEFDMEPDSASEMNRLYEKCWAHLSLEDIALRHQAMMTTVVQHFHCQWAGLAKQSKEGHWVIVASSEPDLMGAHLPNLDCFHSIVKDEGQCIENLNAFPTWSSLPHPHLSKQRVAFLMPFQQEATEPSVFLILHERDDGWTTVINSQHSALRAIIHHVHQNMQRPHVQSDSHLSQSDSQKTLLLNTSKELKDALEREKRLTKLKDEFLSSMSHELRTPLNAILGLTDVLLEGIYGDINASQHKALETINESGRTLLELINDLIDYTRLAGNISQIQPTPLNLDLVLSSAIQAQQPDAKNKEIQILHHQEDLPMIPGDTKRLKRCAVHLIQNAIKFSGPQTTISITYDVSPDFVTVHINDQGIGIHPDFIESAFELLRQADGNLQRTYSGTGLGLSYVSKVLELHNGSIEVASVHGEGSQFSMRIPRSTTD